MDNEPVTITDVHYQLAAELSERIYQFNVEASAHRRRPAAARGGAGRGR
jgi:hypothetical protein